MTKPSKGAAFFLVFFGLMFFIPGLLALFTFVLNRRVNGASATISAMMIALLISAVGAAFVFAAFYGYRKLKEQAAIEASNPSEPWLWRKDWAIRRSESQSKNSEIGAWILCFLGNMILVPVAVTTLPGLVATRDPRGFVMAGFCSLGLILFGIAVRSSLRHRRFGKTWFEFYSLPFVPGDRFTGRIHLKLDADPSRGVDLRLSCIRKKTTGSGKNRSTLQTVLWQTDQTVSGGAVEMAPEGRAIPVDFAIPPDAYVTDHDDPSDEVLWLLHAGADIPGVNYKDDFEVPVFRTAASSAVAGSVSSDSPFAADSSTNNPDFAPVPAPQHPAVVVSAQDGGTDFYFRAFRSPARTLFLLFFTAIWSVVVYFLFHSRAPWFFGFFFGLMDLILVFAVFHMVLGTSRIRVGNGEIVSIRKLLGIGRTRRFPLTEVARVVPVTSGQYGGNQGNAEYAIRLLTKSERSYTLADEISSRQEARWIVSQIEALAGLKIDTRVEVNSIYGPPPQPLQPGFASSGDAAEPAPVRINWQPSKPQSTASTVISLVVFVAIAGGMFVWQGWRFSNLKAAARSNAGRPASHAPVRRVFAPLTDADTKRVASLPAQDQAEELLERAISHDQQALDLFKQNVAGWIGRIRLTDRMKQLEYRAQYSSDLRVRYAGADISLALDGWQENENSADLLIARARSDSNYRAAAVYFLGMLAGRGVAYEKIHAVLLDYARHDPDPRVRQWAVEGMRYLGKDEALDELFESFTQDPAATVRDRAGCNLSDCGNFSRAQRMRMVPKFLKLVSDPGTSPQMRNWSFLALRETTDANVAANPQAWKDWYRDHGAEKLAEFQALEWWQVRGDE